MLEAKFGNRYNDLVIVAQKERKQSEGTRHAKV